MDELLHTLIQQQAIMIAAFYNANSSKDDTKVRAAEFMPKWGEEFPDEDDAAGETEDAESAAPPPDPMAAFGARATGIQLLPGHGARPPNAALGAFFKTPPESPKSD